MKYVSEADLRAYLINDGCDDGCGYLDERDIENMEWVGDYRLIECTECKNFKKEDRYCKLLQINWLPEKFGCNKGDYL